MARLARILISILEGIIKNISRERREYESVDEKSLCLRLYVPKDDEKNSGTKGLIDILKKCT